jgi:uncharacterized protein YggU (UPF0235/DUF167 family)
MTSRNNLSHHQLQDLIFNTKRGAALWIYVAPGSSEDYLEYTSGELIFHSKASCKRHGVNYDLIKWFSKTVGVRPEIAKGWAARRKMLIFPSLSREELLKAIEKLIR